MSHIIYIYDNTCLVSLDAFLIRSTKMLQNVTFLFYYLLYDIIHLFLSERKISI